MTKEVNDIDELEALLAGLNDDELDQLEELDAPVVKAAPVTDPDVSDAELIGDLDETPVSTKKPTRRKKFPSLEDKPTPKSSEEDDLASLADLDEELSPLNVNTVTGKVTSDDPEVNGDDATTVEPPANSQAKMDAARMEEFALEIIDLMGELATKFSLEEEALTLKVQPVIEAINDSSTLAGVKEQMVKLLERDQAQTKLADTPFEPDEVKTQAAEDTDAELEALLAAVPEDPTPKPTPTASTKPTVRPTPTRAAGALNTFIDADKLQEDLSFTETSLSLAMTRQAALFAHYARLSADATYQSDRAKQQVELLEAQLNQRFRDGLVAAGTKFTEKSIDSMVICDSSYQAAQERAHEAKAIASMVATAADSFRHRKDMLIQVGADLRLEKQGELRMKVHPGQSAIDSLEK